MCERASQPRGGGGVCPGGHLSHGAFTGGVCSDTPMDISISIDAYFVYMHPVIIHKAQLVPASIDKLSQGSVDTILSK